MARIGLVTFRGASRTKYVFTAFDFNQPFQSAGGVYVVTRRAKKAVGGVQHEMIYVGETDDFSRLQNLLETHRRGECFKEHYANCLCLHSDSDPKSRKTKQADLIRKFTPACRD